MGGDIVASVKMDAKAAEYKKMTEIYGDLSPEQRVICFSMLEEAAFLKVTLKGLREEITKNGTTDEYKNGANQYGTKVSATLQSYNSTLKNYFVLMEKIVKMFPLSAEKSSDLAELMRA